MAALREGQWELDGFLFGDGTPIWMVEEGWDPGSAEVRTQDADRPHADGSMFGRDSLSGPEWQFTWLVEHGTHVWPMLRQFQQAWRADADRYQPGQLSVLRYREHGLTYRVYGRVRQGDLVAATRRNDRLQQITSTFQLAAPEQHIEDPDTGTRSVVLRLIPLPSGGGLRLPARLPWRLAPGSQQVSGLVDVGGVRPAPFTATVHGPTAGTADGVKLTGPGWHIHAADLTLRFDDEVHIDTRTHTITKNGRPVEGSLSYTSDLTARLEPGRHTFTFLSQDPTNTAYAVVEWMDTVPA